MIMKRNMRKSEGAAIVWGRFVSPKTKSVLLVEKEKKTGKYGLRIEHTSKGVDYRHKKECKKRKLRS